MKVMVKETTITTFVALALLLHGCGSSQEDGGSETTAKPTPTARTTTSTTTTTVSLSACEAALVDSVAAAEKLNVQFFEKNSGVLFRSMTPLPETCNDHHCKGWQLDYANSFMLLNPNSWSPTDNRYTVFPGLWSTGGRLKYGWPGFIGSPEVLKNMVTCSWPSDGGTAGRNQEAIGKTPFRCGCSSWESCGQPDGADWCTEDNHGSECAWKSDETVKMLEAFKQGGGGDMGKGTKAYGLYGYNEVLVHREKWAANLPDSIQAFVIPRDCMPGSKCYDSFAFWYPDWVKEFGAWPMVYLDPENEKVPFSAILQPGQSSCKVGDCVTCPGNLTEMCSGDTCCSDGSACPSASPEFKDCDKPKAFNCVASMDAMV